jgi:hypothetical protein
LGYASQAGRAKTSSKNPQAHAICDRCNFRYNFVDLRVQFEWRGPVLGPIGKIFVCDRCYDTPSEQLRAITLPADPVPIVNARPELYPQDSTDYIGTGATTTAYPSGIPVISQNVLGGATANDTILPQVIGPNILPNAKGQLNPSVIGADPNAQMTPVKATTWARRIPITSIVTNGSPIVTVNCSAIHQLTSGMQTAIWGTSNPLIYGIYNVTVTTATVFTVQANANVATGSVATPTTIVQTVNIGLPWNVTQVPQTGV